MTITLGSNIILQCFDDDVIDACVKANVFDNPEYVSNEKCGRSNRKTQSTISTYAYASGNLVLPRGYMRDLLKILKDHDVEPQIIDDRVSLPCDYADSLQDIELRQYQQKAVDESMHYDQGVIVAPTGSGKTIIALEIIRRKGERALVLCHRTELAKQWVAVIDERLGVTAGFIGDGEWSIGAEITVAMVQTLVDKTETLAGCFGVVIADEIHHCPCDQFYTVIGQLNAKYRYGLSATLQRRDGLEPIIYRCMGPVIATISRFEVEECGATVPATVKAIHTGFTPSAVNSWNEYVDELTENSDRNQFLIDLVERSEGAVLVLTDRVEHAKQLSRMLTTRAVDHVLAHGQLKKEARDGLMDKIKEATVTIGTTSLLGEGLDVSVWGTLIMASPISSEIKLLQAVGRIVRPGVGIYKQNALVYDLRDDCGFSGASFNKRFEIYKKNGIWVEFSQDRKKALRA